MNRRGFMAGILAAGFAPAAIGSGVLMPVRQIVGDGNIIRDCWDYYPMPPGVFYVNRPMLASEIPAWCQQICITPGGSIAFEEWAKLSTHPSAIATKAHFKLAAISPPLAQQ